MRTNSAQGNVADRLVSTLFLAVLAHGIVILGVTFSAPLMNESEALPSLNVTLVVDSAALEAAEDDARWLAQRNQRGSGSSTDGLRPTTTLSASQPVTQAGDPLDADLADGTPRELLAQTEQLMTRSPAERSAALSQPSPAAPAPETRGAMLDHVAQQTLAAEIDLEARMPDEDRADDGSPLASPSTRESILAEYLDTWRRRVERIGTVNFPAELRGRKAAGRPTLEVAIGADGTLEDIVVRQSSGDRTLDQAALSILRLASPFEPLPQAILEEYDVLRFAYEWDFFTPDESSGAVEGFSVER